MQVSKEQYPIPSHSSWDVVDATKLRSFTTCPRMFFYEYVIGLAPDVTANHPAFGSAVHKALEVCLFAYSDINYTTTLEELVRTGMELEKAVMIIVNNTPLLKEMYDAFIKEYQKEVPAEAWALHEPKTPVRAMLALLIYLDTYRFDHKRFRLLSMDGKPSVELSGTIAIGKATLAWKMDVIAEDASNNIVGIEHKTAGGQFWGWPQIWEIDVQPAVYNMVLNAMFPDRYCKLLMNGICWKKTKLVTKKIADNMNVRRHTEFMRVDVTKTNDQMAGSLFSILNKIDDMQQYFEWLSYASVDDQVLKTFPMREVSCTYHYGRPCSYLDYCISIPNPLRMFADGNIPPGYVRKYWNPLETEAKIRKDVEIGL